MGVIETKQAKLTIARQRGGEQGDVITIQIEDKASGVCVAEAFVNPYQFAEALTGLACVPCEFAVGELALVGSRREVKREVVEVPCSWTSPHKRSAIQKGCAPFEADGWRGRYSDAENHHNVRVSGPSRYTVEVVFVRFVDPVTGEPKEIE